MKPTFLAIALLAGTLVAVADAPTPSAPAKHNAAAPITVRAESYPRPPSSEAIYYIYEQSGRTICTKLEVCNKYDNCGAQYIKGAYRAREEQTAGDPYRESPAVTLPHAKLNKHVCLRRFRLIAG